MKRKGVSLQDISFIRSCCLVVKTLTFPLGGWLGDLFPIKTVLFWSVLLGCLSLGLFSTDIIFQSFWTLLFVRMLRSGLNCTWPLFDTVALRFDRRHHNQQAAAAAARGGGGGGGKGGGQVAAGTFGKSRLWVSVAWGTSAVGYGWLMDIGGTSLLLQISYCFAVLLLILIYWLIPIDLSNDDDADPGAGEEQTTGNNNEDFSLKAIVVESIDDLDTGPPLPPSNKSLEHNISNTVTNNNTIQGTLRDLKVLFFRTPGYVPFCLAVVGHGLVMSIFETLLVIWMDDLHSTSTLSGVAVALSTLFELPVFYFATDLIRWYGFRRLMTAVHLATACRLLLNVWVTEHRVWLLLATQLLHSLSFALYWICAVEENQHWVPVKIRATGHSVLGGLFFLAGGIVGSSLWTFLYELHGIFIVFILGAFVQLFLALVQHQRTYPTHKQTNAIFKEK